VVNALSSPVSPQAGGQQAKKESQEWLSALKKHFPAHASWVSEGQEYAQDLISHRYTSARF
jgi:hypothetical protein